MAIVYKHIRKDTGEPFYIGIGKTIARSKSKKYRNEYWKNIVNKYGYEIEILHSGITWEEACELESYYIKLYGRKDLSTGILVNMTDGGDGNNNFSLETIQRIKEKLTGRFVGELNPWHGKKHTDESKIKISLANKNKTISKEHIQSIIKSNTGRKHTDETKLKISISQKAEKNHMWGKRGVKTSMYGKKHTDETKLKMSEKRKGCKLTEEHIQSIIKSNTGRKHTDETKLKISISQKAEKNHMWGKNGSAVSNSKLNSEKVIWIRNNYIKGHIEFGARAMSKRFNVSKTTIMNVINYKLWKNP